VPDSSKSVGSVLGELRELLVAYFKQEAIEPIKELGRFLAWGFAGSLFLAVGLVSLTLAALRALQTETGSTFTGNLSWVPYLVTLAACGIVAALAARAISARKETS
jgi:hypothetical protein